MSRRDVEEAILRPMQRLYLPPRHLRHHDPEAPDARDEALQEYLVALERFPRDILDRVWARTREEHTYSIWPTPATLCQWARAEQLRSGSPGEIEERRQRAGEKAAAYVEEFLRRRSMGKRALREGWAAPLRLYVEAAAWVQAQFLEGLAEAGISVPSELVAGRSLRSTREALALLQEEFAPAIAAGVIDVKVPRSLETAWKREASSPSEASAVLLDDILDRVHSQRNRSRHNRGSER